MAKRRWTRLLPETRRQIIRLSARGKSVPEIMEELDVTHGVVCRVLEPFGGVIRVENWTPSDARLSLARGDSIQAIATTLGVFGIAVCYEIHMPEVPRVLALQGAKVIFNPIGTGMWNEEQLTAGRQDSCV
jgi:hypothetical protein